MVDIRAYAPNAVGPVDVYLVIGLLVNRSPIVWGRLYGVVAVERCIINIFIINDIARAGNANALRIFRLFLSL